MSVSQVYTTQFCLRQAWYNEQELAPLLISEDEV